MPKNTPVEASETIALPLELFKEHLREQSTKKTLLKWQFWLSLLGLTLALAAILALPFLAPAIFLMGGFIVGYLFLGLATTFYAILPLSLGTRLVEQKYQSSILKPDTAEMVLSHPSHPLIKNLSYTLSKTLINSKEHTVFTLKNSEATHKSQATSTLQKEMLFMLNDMENQTRLKKRELIYQRSKLKRKINNNLGNEAVIKKLTTEFTALEEKIKNCETIIAQTKEASGNFNTKHDAEKNSRDIITTLFKSLEDYKNKLPLIKTVRQEIERQKKGQINHPQLKDMFDQQINALEQGVAYHQYSVVSQALKDNIAKSKTELSTHPSQPIAEEIKSTLNLASQTLLEEDLELALDCFPQEATEELAKGLDDSTTHESTLKQLKEWLIKSPLHDNPLNQQINWILANYFFRQFQKDKTPYVTEQACRYALNLDSDNELNAREKEAIILAALYFDAPIQPDSLPAEVQNILLSSHTNPKAFEALKSLMPSQDVATKAIVLSRSEPETEALTTVSEKPPIETPDPKLKR